ncbi:MAG: hypothetical protein KJ645_10760, partial [Planctomycetes bacterium]|nr:hypothetical protein [Planctomycetota bacterium]
MLKIKSYNEYILAIIGSAPVFDRLGETLWPYESVGLNRARPRLREGDAGSGSPRAPEQRFNSLEGNVSRRAAETRRRPPPSA